MYTPLSGQEITPEEPAIGKQDCHHTLLRKIDESSSTASHATHRMTLAEWGETPWQSAPW